MPNIRKRLFGPAVLTNAMATKYTVPAGTKTEIQHIHAMNPGAAVNLTMSIGADAAGVRIYDQLSIPANSQGLVPYPWVKFVMEVGEILQAKDSVGQIVLTIDGEENILG